METRANYVLIGTFTILVVAAIMLFALWLAKSSISRQYDHYDIIFTEAVTGLSQGGMVQYNGIRVGDVDQLRLDPKNPSKVLVRIRVTANTPIKVDTRAKLGLTGLTGVAFIQLTGGTADSALLKRPDSQVIPHIQADDSALSKLLSGGEDIVSKLSVIITRASELLSRDNVDHISHMLKHMDQVTSVVADERQDIRQLLQQLAAASKQMNASLEQTTRLSSNANELLDKHGQAIMQNAARAMASVEHAANQFDQLISDNRDVLNNGVDGLAKLDPAIKQLSRTLRSLQSVIRRFGDNPAGYLLGADRPREFKPK